MCLNLKMVSSGIHIVALIQVKKIGWILEEPLEASKSKLGKKKEQS